MGHLREKGLMFNVSKGSETANEKHLEITFDSRLTFRDNLKATIGRTNKTIGLLRWLQNLQSSAFLRLYKVFVRPYLENRDIINDAT